MARPGLTSHRKFKRLARALGSAILARGVLELLWDSCYEHGEEYVGTADDIAVTVGWSDDPLVLVRALVDAGAPEGQGFIEPTDEAPQGAVCYRVHDLWHHAPEYVSKRRKREMERLGKVAPDALLRHPAPFGGHRPQITNWQDGDGGPPSPSPSPSPAPLPKSGSPAPRGDAEPPVLTFPTVGAKGGSWPLRSAQVAEWQALFPGIEVLSEARKALAWVVANPGRRKTFGGMPRFLVHWLTKATDSTRPAAPALAAPARPRIATGAEWRCHHDPPCHSRYWCERARDESDRAKRRREEAS